MPPTPQGPLRTSWCISALFRGQKRTKNIQKKHPSAAPGPFSQTSFLRQCSLYAVICVSFRIPNNKNTQITAYSEHRRGKPVWLKGPGAAEGCRFCDPYLVTCGFAFCTAAGNLCARSTLWAFEAGSAAKQGFVSISRSNSRSISRSIPI